MADITSAGSGNHNVGATWVGGVVPGNLDNATVANGHTVTNPVGNTVILGNNATPATLCLQTAGTGGTGIYINNGTLVVHSNVKQGNAGWTLGPGSITEFDNTTTAPTWQIGDAHSQANAKLTLAGTSGSRVTVRSKAGGAVGRFIDGSFIGGAKAACDYFDFQRIGDTSNPCWKFYPSSTYSYTWKHGTFDSACGRIEVTVLLPGGVVFAIEDCTFNATGQNLAAGLTSSALTTGVRSLRRNYFAGKLGTAGSGGQWRDVTMKHNVISGMFNSATASTMWAADSGHNVIRQRSANGMQQPGVGNPDAPNYLHLDSDAGIMINIRGIYFSVATEVPISNWILEPGWTDTVGDIFYGSSGVSSSKAWVVERCLVLPIQDGVSAGKRCGQFVSLLGDANVHISARHNTWVADGTAGESGGISYGETYAGHAGIVTEVRSNLVWSPTSPGGYVFHRRSLATVQDGCLAANITNNGKFNLSTGIHGVGYGDLTTPGTGCFSTGTPGANDVIGDPMFADPTRSMATWAVTRGYSVATDYPSQISDAYAALAVNLETRIPDMMTWVAQGWRPSNPTYRQAAYPSDTGDDLFGNPMEGTIGALAYVTTPLPDPDPGSGASSPVVAIGGAVPVTLEASVTFDLLTYDPTTGASANADSVPTCKVRENNTETPILNPTVVARTPAGEYYVTIACTAANGFEAGKSYNSIVTATVGAVTRKWPLPTLLVQAAPVAQTGDAFARIGAGGAALTALGDSRLNNLDVNVGSRAGSNSVIDANVVSINDSPVVLADRVDSNVVAVNDESVTAAGQVDANLVQYMGETPSALVEGRIPARTSDPDIATSGSVDDSTATAAGFQGSVGLSAVNDFYKGQMLVFTSGPNLKVGRWVTSYTGSTRRFTFSNPFPAVPVSGNTFSLLGQEDA